MEGLDGNACRGKDRMSLWGICTHSGAAAELGQEAMAKQDQVALGRPVGDVAVWPEGKNEMPPAWPRRLFGSNGVATQLVGVAEQVVPSAASSGVRVFTLADRP
jgi:hypothetical protein